MNDYLYQTLIAEIRKIFSKKSVMIDRLAEILNIEKGAVYRRIRQEVPFTFREIAIIARQLNISLDRIVGIENIKSTSFHLGLPDFISPQEEDYYMFDAYIKHLDSITKIENSETASVANVFPHELLSEFPNLFLFYLCVWNYHYHEGKILPYSEITVLPGIDKFMKNYMLGMKNFEKTNYVFDGRIFKLFIERVNYFNSIRLIEKKDILKIKEDLLSLMDYLERIALTGKYKETGNFVNLYIADIDITTCYTYMGAKNVHFSMVRAFILSYLTSSNEQTFLKMKKWIQSLIKISTLITLTNERQRVLFFERQRKLINEL